MEIAVDDLHLRHTLESGQAFRWQRLGDGDYEGVIGRRVVRATQRGGTVVLRGASEAVLRHYFQLEADLAAIVRSFPDDPHMRRAAVYCRGLRLLRQESWETLASFICSSTKQIVQIRQIVAHLCRELGEPIRERSARVPACLNSTPFERYTCNVQTAQRATRAAVARESEPRHAFPSVSTVARASEERLRGCKLGFRAKYLLGAARMIEDGGVRLGAIAGMDYPRAVEELTKLPGVGPKIADCALLFAWGRREAFPMDVWIERALRRLYFFGRPRVTRRRMGEFARSYFAPQAGYAQQYLFHYVRHHPQVLEARG